MWSLDWFAARELAAAGTPVRRIAWAVGKWLVLARGLWWVRLPDLTWRIAGNNDFGEAEFRGRDWTPENYLRDVCGYLPAYNTTPPRESSWGDIPHIYPRPVPNFPEVE